MACPLFLPAAPLAGFSDVCGGECAADPGAPIADATLRKCCNAGYARECCTHAAQAESDVFRFAIKAHRGAAVDVAWSSERNHHPLAVGTLTIGEESATEGPLERQARVYAMAYLRQIGA